MKAVILCGGQGTRIREANENLPKPMLPIGGMPILWHIMKIYAHHGINDFILCLGYKGWLVKEFFLNYRTMTSDVLVHLNGRQPPEILGNPGLEDWRVTLAETGDVAQTGSRLAAVRHLLKDESVFSLTYGDGVANVDIRALVAAHTASGKVATVTAVRPPGRYGELCMDGDAVTTFSEKPQTSTGFINGGFLLFDAKRIWPYLPAGPDVALEGKPMQDLVRDRELSAYEHTGFWQAMDTPREYNYLNQLWSDGRAPWKVWD